MLNLFYDLGPFDFPVHVNVFRKMMEYFDETSSFYDSNASNGTDNINNTSQRPT